MTMKHIKLLGLLATAAAVSFTTISCSNSDAGDDVEFPAPEEEGAIPNDLKADELYVYNFPSLMADEENGSTLYFRFGDQRVTTEERTTKGNVTVSGTGNGGAGYTYYPISDTEADININGFTRPTAFNAEKKEFSTRTVQMKIRLKYSPATGTYTAEITGNEYVVNYIRA